MKFPLNFSFCKGPLSSVEFCPSSSTGFRALPRKATLLSQSARKREKEGNRRGRRIREKGEPPL
jgi:hypothetical protein